MTTLMIVEDNPISARILEVNLRKAGYELVVVKTGLDALKILETATEIALIITDIVMDGIDGFQLLRGLRSSARWKQIPVIMYTSLGDMENVRKAAVMGCQHYLVKPVQPGVLVKRVAEVLASERLVLKDKSEAFIQFGLDQDSYRELAATYLDLLRSQVALLERLERNRLMPVQPELRSLAEGASVLGAERLGDSLSQLLVGWTGGKDGQGWLPGYKPLLQELRLADQALSQALA